jgi:hypothetical protein
MLHALLSIPPDGRAFFLPQKTEPAKGSPATLVNIQESFFKKCRE